MECQFAALYTHCHGEFRSTLGAILINAEQQIEGRRLLYEELSTAREVYEDLQSARTALEERSSDLSSIYVMLSLIARRLIWIYSPSNLITQIRMVASWLDRLFVLTVSDGKRFFQSRLQAEIDASEQASLTRTSIDVNTIKQQINNLTTLITEGQDKQIEFDQFLGELRSRIEGDDGKSPIIVRCRELLDEATNIYLHAWYYHHISIVSKCQ